MTGAYQPGESWPAGVIENHADENSPQYNRDSFRRPVYRLKERRWLKADEKIAVGDVFADPGGGNSVVFRCPCGKRDVFLSKHTVSFDDDGKMTVKESMGSVPMYFRGEHWGRNHCHFFIQHGMVKMESDSRCPGKDL